jgi:hypothetical protein
MINGKTNIGANAGNVLWRWTLRCYLTLMDLDIQEALQLSVPRSYKPTTFPDIPYSSHQLWDPVNFELSPQLNRAQKLAADVDVASFCKIFHSYLSNRYPNTSTFTASSITLYARAHIHDKLWQSKYYQEKINSHSRGNHYIWFRSSEQ